MTVAMEAQLGERGPAWRDIAIKLVLAAISVGILFVAWIMYGVGQALFGVCLVMVAIGFFVIYGFRQYYFARFIFPGAAAVLLFIAFPILYTIYLGFTNYSFLNLLTFERAKEVLLSRTVVGEGSERQFGLVNRIRLSRQQTRPAQHVGYAQRAALRQLLLHLGR